MNFFNKFDKLRNDYKDNKLPMASLLFCLFFVLALAVGSSYAYLTFENVAENSNSIVAGTLVLNFLDETDAIYMSGAVPQLDEDGLNYNAEHSFSFENSGTLNVDYKIKLKNSCQVGVPVNVGGETITPEVCIPLDYIKVGVKKDNGTYSVVSMNEDGEIILDTGSLAKRKQAGTYTFKLWLDQSTPIDYQGMDDEGNDRVVAFVGQIELYGEQSATQSSDVSLLTSILGVNNNNVVNSGDGLYSSTDTNDGRPTYYYRGAVENNYLQFGGKSAGNCTYDGHVLLDLTTQSYANKNACLAATGVCDATVGGSSYLIGVDEGTCTASGLTYFSTTPDWNKEVCHYKKEMVLKYTGDGTTLVVDNVPENECASITELCDARADGLGYVAGVNEAFCKAAAANATFITVEEPLSYGEVVEPILWRVVRVNEDQTVRLILNSGYGQTFIPDTNSYEDSYYSNTNVENGAMYFLNNWYNENLIDYDSYVATNMYCEQAKVSDQDGAKFGNVVMQGIDNYTPTFKCSNDANGYGLITDKKIGLLSLDEVMFSGCTSSACNTYITETTTMSPYSEAYEWHVDGSLHGRIADDYFYRLAPVVSLNSDLFVTGKGTLESPWKVVVE